MKLIKKCKKNKKIIWWNEKMVLSLERNTNTLSTNNNEKSSIVLNDCRYIDDYVMQQG